jgi:hypothetical protein
MSRVFIFDYDANHRRRYRTSTSKGTFTVHDIHSASLKLERCSTLSSLTPSHLRSCLDVLIIWLMDLFRLCEDLVHTGAVVLTISAPSARTPGRDWITFTPRDRDEQIQLMVDLRRGVDLLTQHQKVDPARIGYVGYSYGAAMGGLLAGTAASRLWSQG